MKKPWIVEMYYYAKPVSLERFASREDALAYYESRVGACRFGLVGWSVSYPREERAT